jgi:PBP1b-binding outer membrane lipoprotein LpoB
LNAGFAMTILDLVSRVHLALFVNMLKNIYKISHSAAVFDLLSCVMGMAVMRFKTGQIQIESIFMKSIHYRQEY